MGRPRTSPCRPTLWPAGERLARQALSGICQIRPQKIQPDLLQFAAGGRAGSCVCRGEVERETVSPGEWQGERGEEAVGLAGEVEGVLVEGGAQHRTGGDDADANRLARIKPDRPLEEPLQAGGFLDRQ